MEPAYAVGAKDERKVDPAFYFGSALLVKGLLTLKVGDDVWVTIAGAKRGATVIGVAPVWLQRVIVATEDGVRRDVARRLVEPADP